MSIIHLRCPGLRVVAFLLTFFLTTPGLQAVPNPSAATEDFPIYPEIRPNVDFWSRIFTQYSKAQGVIHDAGDLSKVFGVVSLDTAPTAVAENRNRQLKENGLKHHKAILLRLAQGAAPVSPAEKRVAALFGSPPDIRAMQQSSQRLRIQTGLREQFREGLIRSGALVPEFKKILMSYGLPQDLVYLPCVESSFNVQAYSKLGAAGVWQFTRDTGKLYMEIGYVVDERRDPFISTHAAAKLLKRNYAALGSWPLAITAYNHGVNGMKRAQKQHGEYPKIFRHYTSPAFQFASRNFYSEFLAARQVAKNYQAHFGELQLASPVAHTRFTAPGYLSAHDLCQALNLDLNHLQTLNPALRPPVFDGRKFIPKGFSLRLPAKISADHATQALAKHYKDRQNPSRFHRVQAGDTASTIARTHQVSVQDLVLANGLNRKAAIYIGQTLRLPVKAEPQASPAAETAPVQTAPVQTAPDQTAQTAQIQAVESQNAPAQSAQTTLTLATLDNNTKNKGIEKTGTLPQAVPVVPAPAEPMPAESKPAPPEPKPGPEPKAVQTPAEPQTRQAGPVRSDAPAATDALAGATPGNGETPAGLMTVTADLRIQKQIQTKNTTMGIIHVAPEETLGHYADWLKVTSKRIRLMNRMPADKPISIGQAIKVPLEKGSEDFEEQRYEFHKEMVEDFFSSYSVFGTETYTVKTGDNLWKICTNELEIPLWLLEKYNPGIHELQPGQKIRYPQVGPNVPPPAGSRAMR